MLLLRKIIVILFIFVSSSCSTISSKVEKRSPSSTYDCITGIEKIFALANDNFLEYLDAVEISKIKNKYLYTTFVLDQKNIAYKFVKIFNDDESFIAIEISDKGKHHLSKYLRRIKAINSNIKFYFSKDLMDDSEGAAYFPSVEGIVLGKSVVNYIKDDLPEEYISIFSHEMRHAQLDKYLKESGKNSYAGVFLRIAGRSRNEYYDDILSLDESYTFMKDIKTIIARIKKNKRLGKDTVQLEKTLEFNIFLGKKITNQMLKSLRIFLNETPEVIVDSSSNGTFLSYLYHTKNKEKEFLFSIKPIKDDKYDLTENEEILLKLKASSVLNEQINLIESNLETMIKIERGIE